MERTATWSSIGTDVRELTTVEDVLAKAKLNYLVHKEPITTQSGIIIPDRVATVAEEETPRYLGCVSPKFEILQNEDAFGFVNDIHEGFEFVKAGETHNGMVYIIGKLPDMDILGDKVTPHVIVQNGHNGRYGLRTTIVPLRIVCQNQFNMAFKESPNTIHIKHSANITTRLEEAQRLLKGVAAYMDTFEANANELANIKFGREGAIQVIDSFFKKMADAKSSEASVLKVMDQRDSFIRAYNDEDNQNFLGTGWGLVNAFTDFETHKQVKQTENAADSKFLTVTFDPKAMNMFMEHLYAMAPAA